MIVVIADDFTGASEMGGIGIRYGLDVEIQTELDLNTKAELIVVDTNSRSLSADKARKKIWAIAASLSTGDVDWIFKKTDSIMRGHILIELETLLTTLQMPSALLVPASPSIERVVADGKYFVQGKLLSETDFSRDPEYPAHTSDVLELLGSSDALPIRYIRAGDSLPDFGITIAETRDKSDLGLWASGIDHRIIPAGSAEFFAAILEARGYTQRIHRGAKDILAEKSVLMICGSSLPFCRKLHERIQGKGFSRVPLPCSVINSDGLSDECLQQWITDTVNIFATSQRVMVVIDQPIVNNPGVAHHLTTFMMKLAQSIVENIGINELIIEGGSTASAIVRGLSFQRLVPTTELARGVVRMKPKVKSDLHLTVKPGSYAWPENFW